MSGSLPDCSYCGAPDGWHTMSCRRGLLTVVPNELGPAWPSRPGYRWVKTPAGWAEEPDTIHFERSFYQTAKVEETPWGMVYVWRGKRYTPLVAGDEKYDPYRPGVRELPEWHRPTAALVRYTDDERWRNWREVALAELDREYPDEP